MATDIGPLLDSAAGLAERNFLAAGQRLERATGILERLASRFDAYVAELTEGVLDEAGSRLASAGEQVSQLATAHASDTAALERLGRIVMAAHQHGAALAPVIRQVDTLSMAARLIAGGMGVAGADFLAFSASIRQASVRADTRLRQVRDGLAAMGRLLNATRDEATQFARQHGSAMHAVPARLATGLNSLAERKRLTGAAVATARERSQAISRQVAEQIFALQLGDIVRQRLEHVRMAVPLLDACPVRGLLGRLLAAQLDDTAGELEGQGERIESGLSELAAAAGDIGRLGVEVHDEADGRSNFIAAVRGDLRQTEALLDDLRSADARSDHRMDAVLTAAGELVSGLETLQSVHEDIRFTGLNATLKCGRLGTAGRPLAAVAQELRGCSGSFAAFAAEAVKQLGQLRDVASGLRDPSRASRHAALTATTQEMLGALERLDRLESELGEVLAQLQDDADQVKGLVDAALAEFAGRHRLAATIRQVAADILAGSVAGNAGPIDAAAQAALNRIAAGYTMAREREVHARFAPLPEEPAMVADAADVLF